MGSENARMVERCATNITLEELCVAFEVMQEVHDVAPTDLPFGGLIETIRYVLPPIQNTNWISY